MNHRGEVSLHLILTIFLGLGMLLFGVLAIVAYQDNSHTQHHVNSLKAAAAEQAAAAQKQSDTIANAKANELPYRTYTADPVDGSFQFQFPKNWSVYAAKSPGQSPSIDLISDPDVVNNFTSGSSINTHQFELQLVNQSLSQVNKSFEQALKKHTLTSKPTTVSGIPATWYEGIIDSKGHNGIIVTLTDRNQTMIITDDTHSYVNEFTAILASAKIVP